MSGIRNQSSCSSCNASVYPVVVVNVCPSLLVAHSFPDSVGASVPSDSTPLAVLWMHPHMALWSEDLNGTQQVSGANFTSAGSIGIGSPSASTSRDALCASRWAVASWARQTEAWKWSAPGLELTVSSLLGDTLQEENPFYSNLTGRIDWSSAAIAPRSTIGSRLQGVASTDSSVSSTGTTAAIQSGFHGSSAMPPPLYIREGDGSTPALIPTTGLISGGALAFSTVPTHGIAAFHLGRQHWVQEGSLTSPLRNSSLVTSNTASITSKYIDRIMHQPMQLGVTNETIDGLRDLTPVLPGIETMIPMIETHLRGVPPETWCRLEAEALLKEEAAE